MVSKLKFLLNQRITPKQALQIHACIIVNSVTHLEPLLVRQVLLSVSNYSASIIRYVELILHHMQAPDAFSWGFTVRFLSQNGRFSEACSLYSEMQRLGLCPSSFAVSSALRACARKVDKVGGSLIHAQAHKLGFCGCVYVQTALLDLYSRVGDMETAQRIFDEMPERNVVSWNSALSGYVKTGNVKMARKIFDEIPEKDVVSWNSMISGYARVRNMEQAALLFQQMPERDSASWNAMLSGYIDYGNIESARRLFDAMPQQSSVSWITMIAGYSKCGDVDSARILFDQIAVKDLLIYNAMIACYAQNSRAQEALQLFNDMIQPDVDILPDEITFSSIISACSQLGDLTSGFWIESCMRKLGIRMDDHLITALIDLYAKCGSIDKAYELFNDSRKKDVVSYSAMILGLGMNGRAVDAIRLFKEMVEAGINPNLHTFSGLLAAYSHAGLVEEGYRCFKSMRDYGLVASVDHYGIMVDLLGRAGLIKEAYNLIASMPTQPHSGVWGALLLACRMHNNVEIGEIAGMHCFELEPDRAGYYSLLANIYASAGLWTNVKKIRNIMQEKGFTKVPGCSWVESGLYI
ncbi:hypothetical protein CRG98_023435 [Punica granatum]|uniref:Pentatricopeptide repeat-containing protein At4g22760 n=1 Tax=Punica granatum TaxID=22663 RepID=A0A2I0JIS5_PUNGR|nr:hypothetical protein CRG98_023435 [Punica granatum]